jgi:hypothetical protein
MFTKLSDDAQVGKVIAGTDKEKNIGMPQKREDPYLLLEIINHLLSLWID